MSDYRLPQTLSSDKSSGIAIVTLHRSIVSGNRVAEKEGSNKHPGGISIVSDRRMMAQKLEQLRRRCQEKDWFIYQAGGLLTMLLLCSGLIAAALIYWLYPEHIRATAAHVQVGRALTISMLSTVGTVIVDSAVVKLQKHGFLEKDSN